MRNLRLWGVCAALLATAACEPREVATARYRHAFVHSKPEDHGIQGTHEVWGLLVDSNEGRLTLTTTALANGEAGYFLSNGSARYGGSGHENAEVRTAAKKLCARAGDFLEATTPRRELRPPASDQWQFVLLTPTDIRSATVSQEQMIQGHELSQLYWATIDFRDALNRSIDE